MGLNSQDLLTGFALFLVFEGLMPFLSPRNWRQMLAQLATLSDRGLRIAGLISMLIGLALLAWARA